MHDEEVVVTSAYVRHMLSRCGFTFSDDEWDRMWAAQPYETKNMLLGMRGDAYARMTNVTLDQF